MKLPKLYQRLFRAPDPGDDGAGGTPAAPPAPAAEPAAPPAEPASTPAPAEPSGAAAPAAEAVDPFAGLTAALDSISEPAPKPGAPAAAEPAAPAAPGAPAATPAPTAAPAAAKPADVDLTPPEGMSQRAQERWGQLTERVKQVPELERRANEAETQLGSVRQLVAESGLQASEFTEMLETGRLLKSTDAADLEKALQRIDEVRTTLALRLGKDLPGADPLAAHADLKAEVESMTLTRERALEIAALRAKGNQADTVTREQREADNFRQTVQSAAKNMEVTLAKRASTPGHEAKVAHIKQYLSVPANLQGFVKTYQPQQWEAAILLMYDTYTPPLTAGPPPPPQPLRPGNVRPGAGVATGPVTAQAAVEGAFDRLGL